jgi:hypothetical protein
VVEIASAHAKIFGVVEEAADAVLTWIREGIVRAMERHNRRPEGENPG